MRDPYHVLCHLKTYALGDTGQEKVVYAEYRPIIIDGEMKVLVKFFLLVECLPADLGHK